MTPCDALHKVTAILAILHRIKPCTFSAPVLSSLVVSVFFLSLPKKDCDFRFRAMKEFLYRDFSIQISQNFFTCKEYFREVINDNRVPMILSKRNIEFCF